MTVYVVAYELFDPSDDKIINDAMLALGSIRLFGSVWLVSTVRSAADMREWIKNLIDDAGKVVVVEMRADWATYGANISTKLWLQSQLDPEAKV